MRRAQDKLHVGLSKFEDSITELARLAPWVQYPNLSDFVYNLQVNLQDDFNDI